VRTELGVAVLVRVSIWSCRSIKQRPSLSWIETSQTFLFGRDRKEGEDHPKISGTCSGFEVDLPVPLPPPSLQCFEDDSCPEQSNHQIGGPEVVLYLNLDADRNGWSKYIFIWAGQFQRRLYLRIISIAPSRTRLRPFLRGPFCFVADRFKRTYLSRREILQRDSFNLPRAQEFMRWSCVVRAVRLRWYLLRHRDAARDALVERLEDWMHQSHGEGLIYVWSMLTDQNALGPIFLKSAVSLRALRSGDEHCLYTPILPGLERIRGRNFSNVWNQVSLTSL